MEKAQNMISKWLEEHGDPEIEQFVEKNLAIADKVHNALEAKGWSKVEFAKAMGKNPSEVSKWLGGLHNLTLKSIVKMEMVLGIDLILTEPEKEYTYVYLGKIESPSDYDSKVAEYTDGSTEQQTRIAI